MIKQFLKSFFGDDRDERKALKKQIVKARETDIKELQKVNKRIKLLLAEGHVEIVIRNVKGVIKEDYGKKRK